MKLFLKLLVCTFMVGGLLFARADKKDVRDCQKKSLCYRAIMLVKVSFFWDGLSDAPATNIICGGSSAIALKYEYGAKLTMPFLSRDDIHPIGLGNINDL